jgi:HSP20 family protein
VAEERKEERSLPVRREERIPSLFEEAWESPLSLMRRMREDIDRMLSGFGLPSLRFPEFMTFETPRVITPAVDVWETEDEVKVRADLPGVEPDDIEIFTTEDSITLRGEVRREREEKEKGYYRAERRYGRFERILPLPVEIKPNEAKATFKHGTIEITLPKTERAKEHMKKVPVEVQEEQVAGVKGGESGKEKKSK